MDCDVIDADNGDCGRFRFAVVAECHQTNNFSGASSFLNEVACTMRDINTRNSERLHKTIV